MERIFKRKLRLSLRPRVSSTANVFAQRGDPLVSPREQLRDFGRNLQSEDVELDAEIQRDAGRISGKGSLNPVQLGKHENAELERYTQAKKAADRLFEKPKRNFFDEGRRTDKKKSLQYRAAQLALQSRREVAVVRCRGDVKRVFDCPRLGCNIKFHNERQVSEHLRQGKCKGRKYEKQNTEI